MRERDHQRPGAVGAAASPGDPDGDAPEDLVQAVVELVDDLVDETDPAISPG